MNRFEVISAEQMTPRQREVAADIASGPRGALKGPFLALIHSPELAAKVQVLGEHLRFGTGLSQHLVEIAVLVTARRWSCQYEWHAHARIAREAGVPDSIIAAIALDARPVVMGPDETLIHDFAHETVWQGSPSGDSFNALTARFGKPATLDVMAICGYYTLLAFVLNAADFTLPPGATQLAPLPATPLGGAN
ncbi:MAG: carboxymuconolactone decarboxylase family protein [Comamonadaceae bacterium]|nr:MAG: carboxymuconolactone decarboxylase family protein [Comamonadaceae bacterium]